MKLPEQLTLLEGLSDYINAHPANISLDKNSIYWATYNKRNIGISMIDGTVTVYEKDKDVLVLFHSRHEPIQRFFRDVDYLYHHG